MKPSNVLSTKSDIVKEEEIGTKPTDQEKTPEEIGMKPNVEKGNLFRPRFREESCKICEK